LVQIYWKRVGDLCQIAKIVERSTINHFAIDNMGIII